MGGGMGGGCNPMAQQQMMMQQQQQMMMQQQQMMNNMMMGGGGCDMKKMQEMMNQMMGVSGSKKEKKGDKSGKKKPKSNDMVIFVGGLRKTTEEDRVTAHFAKFGQVEQVDIKRLPDGTSRGFAFVKFSDHDAVEKVIDAHAKHMIDNKWVEVKRHDGIAASAGLTTSMQKATEEPEEEAEPPGEEFAEKWSEQYLAMASKLAENEKDGGGEKEAGKESGSSKKSPFEKLMKQMGMDPAVMKQMGMDPKQMEGMFKQMGIDPSMMTQMMGSPAENMYLYHFDGYSWLWLQDAVGPDVDSWTLAYCAFIAAVLVAMVAWADVAQAAVRDAWALAVAAAVDAAAAAVEEDDAWDVVGLVAATSRFLVAEYPSWVSYLRRRPRTAVTARGRLPREEVVAQVPGLADLADPAARALVALAAQDILLHTQLFALLAQSFMGFFLPMKQFGIQGKETERLQGPCGPGPCGPCGPGPCGPCGGCLGFLADDNTAPLLRPSAINHRRKKEGEPIIRIIRKTGRCACSKFNGIRAYP
ncbi:CELF4 [Symbiodinium sp. CCMP2592]|nr:CELF4 [Symbiodinium sp. CCMP2592]